MEEKETGACRSETGRIAAIVLAAGQGKRMESSVRKQFMLLDGKPLIYYALKAFETSEADDIILVTGKEEVAYCRENIVARFGFSKVRRVVPGGKERYHSVYEGLKALKDIEMEKKDGQGEYSGVLIHDGARPFLTGEMIRSCITGIEKYQACVAGMPVKDTIKITDEQGFAVETPRRSLLWQVQTPQAFSYRLVLQAYEKLFSELVEQERTGLPCKREITDDAMVVEAMTNIKVKLIQGSYRNIKITTPDDMILANAFLKQL